MLATAKALSVLPDSGAEPHRDGARVRRSAVLAVAVALGCALMTCSQAQAAPLSATTVSVDCGLGVVVAQAATCTATVTDTEATPSAPTGTVAFTTSSQGAFGEATCELSPLGEAQSSCSVKYEPTVSGTHEITGAYGGDSAHETSSGTGALAVAGRMTTVAVDCGAGVVVAQAATCTATVTDTDPEGTPSSPTGMVSFTSDSQGAFTPTTCELSQSAEAQASCSVKYEPTAVGLGTQKITGAYLGDGAHIAGSSSATLTVSPAPATSQGGGTTTTSAPAQAPATTTPGPVAPRVTPKCRVRAKERWRLVGPRRRKIEVPQLVVTYSCDQSAAVLVGGAVRIAAVRYKEKLTKPRTVKLATVSAKAVLGKAQPGVVLALPAVAAKALRKGVRTEATVTFTVKNANGTGIGTIKFLILPPARVTHATG
jgi:hypothetical protein